VVLLQVASQNSHIIEETKPHGTLGSGVMSRGAHGAKRLPYPALHDGISGSQRAGNGFQGHCVRVTTHNRIRVEGRPAAGTGGLHQPDMSEIMYGSSPGCGIMIALKSHEMLRLATRLQGLHDRLESARAFGMVIASMMLQVIGMINQTDVHSVLLDQNVCA
jgi:hypothetical protein